MSHYLQTIVAKNMGHLSVVRPRLASRFEPPAETVSLMPQFPVEVEAETSENISTPASQPVWRQRQPEIQSDIVRRADHVRSMPSSQVPQPTVLPSTPPTNSDTSVSPSPLKPRDLPAALSSSSPSTLTPNLSETDVLSSSASVVEPHTETNLPRSTAANIPVIQPTSPSLASTPASTPSKQPGIEPVQPWLVGPSQSSPTDTNGPSAEPLSTPEFLSSPRSFSRLSSPPSSETSRPTIQVTIGRIDLRAVTPKSSPPKSPKPRPAKPSLQDYLKTRNRSRHGV